MTSLHLFLSLSYLLFYHYNLNRSLTKVLTFLNKLWKRGKGGMTLSFRLFPYITIITLILMGNLIHSRDGPDTWFCQIFSIRLCIKYPEVSKEYNLSCIFLILRSFDISNWNLTFHAKQDIRFFRGFVPDIRKIKYPVQR